MGGFQRLDQRPIVEQPVHAPGIDQAQVHRLLPSFGARILT
jgi:hypothetical protein